MPTPSTDSIPQQSLVAAHHRPVHATCPPEDDRHQDVSETSPAEETPQTLADSETLHDAPNGVERESRGGAMDILDAAPQSTLPSQDLDTSSEETGDTPSPISVLEDPKIDVVQVVHDPLSPTTGACLPATLKYPTVPHLRPLPKYTPSFLRHGSKFAGTQQSDRQVYKVQVEIKHVDMAESFICGYLRIEGLTADHPTLTTYFEGEIIGTKYTFQTRHAEWGSNEKVDMQHWNRFQAWKPLARAARRPDFSYKNFADREHIFMRWKEYFLVPDHRVRTISGASFEGFYYICFNQLSGTVSGIYFHARSEKFQQLELTHVDDRGCLGAVEFR